jgi:transposase
VKRQKRSMRQVHRAGEKLFIDYCGPTVEVHDAQWRAARAAQIFVAVLGASSYTYAEATWTQACPTGSARTSAPLRSSGVPELLIPDNLRAAVSWPTATPPSPTPPIRLGPALTHQKQKGISGYHVE